jgi:type II secretory pathway component PulC
MTAPIELFHLIVRMPKEHSSFLYFQLEASEGLGFYSTIDFQEGDVYRDIDIKGDLKLKNEMMTLLNSLKEKTFLEILTDERILDQ